jgi:hypothetical protein
MLIQVDPTDHQKIWIAFESSSNGQRVYRSVNGGGTWTNLTTSALNGHAPHSLNLIGGTDGGIYLSTQNTIFYRNNTMSDWVDFGDGLPVEISIRVLRDHFTAMEKCASPPTEKAFGKAVCRNNRVFQLRRSWSIS